MRARAACVRAGIIILAVAVNAAAVEGRNERADSGLDDRQLANLVAFTRLLGYVRYFHPSDAAAATDWRRFAVEGMRQVEGAGDARALAHRLTALFVPIAPTVRVFRTGSAAGSVAPLREAQDLRVVAWRHVGLQAQGPGDIYGSRRAYAPAAEAAADRAFPDPLRPLVADLGGGVSCAVPLAVFADEHGTLPGARTVEPSSGMVYSARDRSTRLAIVALAWNVLQHSYPYFEFTSTSWYGSLYASLRAAARDVDDLQFLDTLRRMIAGLRDGHGLVNYRGESFGSVLPLRWGWIEGRLVVTEVLSDRMRGLAPGDAVLTIDGRAAERALREKEALISGATAQWIRIRALRRSLRCGGRSSRTVEIERYPDLSRHRLTVPCMPPEDIAAALSRAPPAESLFEIEPRIFYVDLGRIDSAQFERALVRLEQAEGIVFDLRGYPGGVDPFRLFSRLTTVPITSAQWHVPHIRLPDCVAMAFRRENEWSIQPRAPYLDARKAFITDGRAISYAESCMGIVEHYGLGEIVGAPTAGTNGNINIMELPAGYSIVWTGMKVLKHDGSRHHGVGIRPTIAAAPTRAGIAAGRDELLERALRAVRRPQAE